MDKFTFFTERIAQHAEVIKTLLASEKQLELLETVSDTIVQAFKQKRQLLVCGNGGSAADAQHIATEFVCRFFLNRPAINAEALTTNTSSLTAIANDFSFPSIFSRQVEAKGAPGDVLMGISTSGSSENVINAMQKAKETGMVTIALTGNKTPECLAEVSDYVFNAPSDITPRIQECHILYAHLICEYVELKLSE